MPTFSNNRYATATLPPQLHVSHGSPAAEYRTFCADLRRDMGIDFTDRPHPIWLGHTPNERTQVLQNLQHAYPGVRDPVATVVCFRWMLSAFEGDGRRGPRNTALAIIGAAAAIVRPQASS
jgi:hypothetical protein